MLSVVHGSAFALRLDVRLQGPHLGTVGVQLGHRGRGSGRTSRSCRGAGPRGPTAPGTSDRFRGACWRRSGGTCRRKPPRCCPAHWHRGKSASPRPRTSPSPVSRSSRSGWVKLPYVSPLAWPPLSRSELSAGGFSRVLLLLFRHPVCLGMAAFPLVHQAVGQGLALQRLGDFDGVAAVAGADLDRALAHRWTRFWRAAASALATGRGAVDS